MSVSQMSADEAEAIRLCTASYVNEMMGKIGELSDTKVALIVASLFSNAATLAVAGDFPRDLFIGLAGGAFDSHARLKRQS